LEVFATQYAPCVDQLGGHELPTLGIIGFGLDVFATQYAPCVDQPDGHELPIFITAGLAELLVGTHIPLLVE
jgi:hypothetical protein